MKKILKENWIILLIVLVGLALRLYHLSLDNLSRDEIVTLNGVQENLRDILRHMPSQDLNPPIYWIFLHYWTKLFGQNEFVIRIPSVIFSTLSILAIYKFGKLTFNKTVGLIAALLLALSVSQIFYAQLARAYGLLILLVLGSMYFLFKLSKKFELKTAFAYTLITILIIYTHNLGILILTAQNIFALVIFFLSKKKFPINKWLIILLIILVSYLFWLPIVNNQFVALYDCCRTIPSFNIEYLKEITLALAGSKVMLFSSLVLISLGIFSVFKKSIFFLLWLVIPATIIFLCYLLFNLPFFTARVLLAYMLPVFILSALGITQLKNKFLISIVILFMVILSVINFNYYYSHPRERNFKEAAQYLDQNVKEGDFVVFYGPFEIVDLYRYYSPRKIEVKPLFHRDYFTDNLKSQFKSHEKIWMLFIDASIAGKSEFLPILSGYEVKTKDFYGISIFQFSK